MYRHHISSVHISAQHATSEVQLGCRHELQSQSKSDPDPPVEFEEEESEENETADAHVPLELFAEVRYQMHKFLTYMVENINEQWACFGQCFWDFKSAVFLWFSVPGGCDDKKFPTCEETLPDEYVFIFYKIISFSYILTLTCSDYLFYGLFV